MKDIKIFNLNVSLLIELLKWKNPDLVYSYENSLHCFMGSDFTVDVFIAVLFLLSDTNSEIFIWFLKNLKSLKCYQSVIKIVSYYATYKLVEQGFTPGKDFSANTQGQILITQKAKTTFLQSVLALEDRILLKEILQVS
ncbi:hypothetical protein SD80_022470 [Scytonema tolypothrichoides VB-61278]|nr:hypothetical protein SD80_022470 [Scytonema tolypothrichoides VB-61278]